MNCPIEVAAFCTMVAQHPSQDACTKVTTAVHSQIPGVDKVSVSIESLYLESFGVMGTGQTLSSLFDPVNHIADELLWPVQ